MHDQNRKWMQYRDNPICFVDHGEGPPIVLLHGLGSSMLHWHDVIGPLSANHRVIAVDMPGHGSSSAPTARKRYTVHEALVVLDALFSHLNIEQPVLIGQSMGGLIALRYALKRPRNVSALVLSASAGLGKEISPRIKLLGRPLLGPRIYKGTPKEVLDKWLWLLHDPKKIPATIVEDFHIQANEGNRRALLYSANEGVGLFGQRRRILLSDKELSSISAPTLIVWGREDDLVPPVHGVRASVLIPNASMQIFDDCGHQPPVEWPKEFCETVLSFLEQQ